MPATPVPHAISIATTRRSPGRELSFSANWTTSAGCAALPYWLECRPDDPAPRHPGPSKRLLAMSEERYAWLERPLAARLAQARHAPVAATLAGLPRGFRLRELAGKCEAVSAAGARVSVKA